MVAAGTAGGVYAKGRVLRQIKSKSGEDDSENKGH